MSIPSVGNGYQANDGNLNEVKISVAPVPVAVAGDTVTLTAAQITNGIILASPTTTAAYTLPTVANLEVVVDNAKVGVTFDFRIINVTGSGVITVTTSTGWTIGSSGSQGLMTIAASAGTVRAFRARKTGDAAWALYAIS